jgi:NADPH:quinone reductase-like Zn-dependent oxidoreductase
MTRVAMSPTNEWPSPTLFLLRPAASMDLPPKALWSSVAVVPALFLLYALLKKRATRTRQIALASERVLVLGASSGIGKEIALKYARRGAHLCIVARRKEVLASVLQECQAVNGGSASVIAVAADFSNVDDLVNVRDAIERGSLPSE